MSRIVDFFDLPHDAKEAAVDAAFGIGIGRMSTLAVQLRAVSTLGHVRRLASLELARREALER
jgi:hypothetical protein